MTCPRLLPMNSPLRIVANKFCFRERRIVRAFDQSFKRKPLAPEVAAAYDPYDVSEYFSKFPKGCSVANFIVGVFLSSQLYLQENVELAEFEQAEKEVIRG